MRSFRKQFVAISVATLLLGGCAGAGTKTGEFVDDSAITAKVKTTFAKDPEVSALKVHVDTEKGVVTLSGKVKTEQERAKAAELARSTAGVRAVNNNLTLASN